ncbi:hypothetical protein K466DRAFT_17261 [Polyporus arcularius HHB13444]|uniref:Uncharacterized protein n=1 Tax=Polyporus arcularius HHB13444 TaxID=1314778 RepID=A0A5C3NSQ3_9APHY|nr:hypothetical protein K466DRAFT_17261 [Polyporus arcularius HHB13444]
MVGPLGGGSRTAGFCAVARLARGNRSIALRSTGMQTDHRPARKCSLPSGSHPASCLPPLRRMPSVLAQRVLQMCHIGHHRVAVESEENATAHQIIYPRLTRHRVPSISAALTDHLNAARTQNKTEIRQQEQTHRYIQHRYTPAVSLVHGMRKSCQIP